MPERRFIRRGEHGSFAAVFRKIALYLDLIKFAHSVFALPFALIALLVATDGRPGWRVLGWVTAAMVGARTAAMAFNRLVDRRQDALNPRTARRPSVTGAVRPVETALLCAVGAGVFLLAAAMLNPLCLLLSPFVLAILLLYSWTKRFTHWPHLFLGLALGLAPLGAWIAATGRLDWAPVVLGLGVLFWVAGFDILYALQDETFDREHGIGSLPARYGAAKALGISRVFHLLTVGLLVAFGFLSHRGLAWYAGVILVAVTLAVEQAMVTAEDRSRINAAFFTANGVVGLVLLVMACVDVYF